MSLPYELWDSETGNMIGNYATEDEALDRVRRDLESSGPELVGALALDGPDAAGRKCQIAEGDALLALARRLPI